MLSKKCLISRKRIIIRTAISGSSYEYSKYKNLIFKRGFFSKGEVITKYFPPYCLHCKYKNNCKDINIFIGETPYMMYALCEPINLIRSNIYYTLDDVI